MSSPSLFLDLDKEWSLRCFTLSRSSAVAARFLPQCVRVEALGHKLAATFWSGDDRLGMTRHPWAVALIAGGEDEGGPAGDEAPPSDREEGDAFADAMADLLDEDGPLMGEWVYQVGTERNDAEDDVPEAGAAASSPAVDGARPAEAGAPSQVPAEFAEGAGVEAQAAQPGEAAAVFSVPGGIVAYYEKGTGSTGTARCPRMGRSAAWSGRRKKAAGQGKGVPWVWSRRGSRIEATTPPRRTI